MEFRAVILNRTLWVNYSNVTQPLSQKVVFRKGIPFLFQKCQVGVDVYVYTAHCARIYSVIYILSMMAGDNS